MAYPGAIDVVYDTVGKKETFEVGARVLKARGTLVKAGVHGPTQWEDTPLYFKELSMVGSNAFGFEEIDGVRRHGIEHYLDLVADGRIDLTGMLTHTFDLDDWRDAFTALATQDTSGAIKTAFDFRFPLRALRARPLEPRSPRAAADRLGDGSLGSRLRRSGQREGLDEAVEVGLHRGLELDGRLPEADDDEVERRDDEGVLALVAVRAERAEVVVPEPPVGAVAVGLLGRRRRRRHRPRVVDPTLGEEARPVPHAVVEVQLTEAGEVAGGRVHVRRADERAGGVERAGSPTSSRSARTARARGTLRIPASPPPIARPASALTMLVVPLE